MFKRIQSVPKYLLLSAMFLCGLAVATEYFLVTFNMAMETDRETEWSSAQNFFSQAQNVLNKDGGWRAGDTFVVKYNGGAIAKFPLSKRGMACAGVKCFWVTTVPFDDPTVVQAVNSAVGKTPVLIAPQGATATIPKTPVTPGGTLFYTVYYYWTIIMGGSPEPGLGGGGYTGGGGGGGPIHLPE